jgi:hypothetical protein
MPKGQLAALSYEAAIRALDLQERAAEQLRARTGTLLGASSLTASFLGAQAIQRGGGIGTVAGLALIALTCSVGLCVYVLLPKRGLVFEISPSTLYESLFDIADDEQEMHRRLAYWLEDFWRTKQAKIDRLAHFYLAAAATLMLQLAFWAWALADSIR